MTVTVQTPVRWGDVTLREFAALDLLRWDTGLDRLNAYWDETAKLNPFNPDNTPTRLTAEGAEWFERLRQQVTGTDRDQLDAARELLRVLGTLAVMGAHRDPTR